MISRVKNAMKLSFLYNHSNYPKIQDGYRRFNYDKLGEQQVPLNPRWLILKKSSFTVFQFCDPQAKVYSSSHKLVILSIYFTITFIHL